MCVVLIVLALINGALFVQAGPTPDATVYNTMLEQSREKCPYLKKTLLGTEPEFLKPCTNFNKLTTIKSVTNHNIDDVQCTIYYNDYMLLCFSNVTLEELVNHINEEKMKIALKGNTVASVCEVLKGHSHVIATVEEPMHVILKYFTNEMLCQRICSDYDGQLLASCNLAAYMSKVILMHNASRAQPVNKDAPTNLLRLRTKSLLAQTSNVSINTDLAKVIPDTASINRRLVANSSEYSAIKNHKLIESPPNNATGVNRKLIDLSLDSGAGPAKMSAKNETLTVKADGETKQGKLQEQHVNVAEQGVADSKIPEETARKVDNTAPEEIYQVPPPILPPGGTNVSVNKETATKVEQANRSGTILLGKKNESKTESENDGAMNVMLKKNKDEQAGIFAEEISPPTDVDQKFGEYEMEKPEDGKDSEDADTFDDATIADQPENPKQPEANKLLESKPKTSGPKENVDDNIVLSATYNQHLDEDDSYFFSYFMMVCGVFILAYVGYHNKQKVFALMLEGRRGRRTSRSRRPNSANYHKLDTNLEEAVTSPCNKNTTSIIY